MKDNTKEINKATNLGSLEPLRQYKLPLSILPVHSPTFLSYHGTGVPVPDPAYSYWGIKKVLQFDITAGFSQMMPIHHPRKKVYCRRLHALREGTGEVCSCCNYECLWRDHMLMGTMT
jgi:hypothetical protein